MKALLICLLLAGCATSGPETVKVPVSVPCIEPSDTPSKPNLTFEQLPWVDGKTAAQRLLADFYALQAYSTRLEIQLAGCMTK